MLLREFGNVRANKETNESFYNLYKGVYTMITLIDSELTKDASYRVTLHADTKDDVADGITGADIPEIPNDAVLAPFSIVITNSFEVAILGSDTKWNWK